MNWKYVLFERIWIHMIEITQSRVSERSSTAFRRGAFGWIPIWLFIIFLIIKSMYLFVITGVLMFFSHLANSILHGSFLSIKNIYSGCINTLAIHEPRRLMNCILLYWLYWWPWSSWTRNRASGTGSQASGIWHQAPSFTTTTHLYPHIHDFDTVTDSHDHLRVLL